MVEYACMYVCSRKGKIKGLNHHLKNMQIGERGRQYSLVRGLCEKEISKRGLLHLDL